MKYTLSRIYLLLMLLIGFAAQAQNSGLKVSDGSLNINGKAFPVKIFATTWGPDFASFPSSPEVQNQNVLVILNQHVIDLMNDEAEQTGASFTLQNYDRVRYIALDKNFKPVSGLNQAKYFYHPNSEESIIDGTSKVKLKTPFKIWNPPIGIPLGKMTLHFYSLMFVFAFGLGYILMKKIFINDKVDLKYLDPFFTWTLIGTILGARLGHVIFYQRELFQQDFWSVFLPIQTKPHFAFTGFSGLASHGATIALIFTTLYYAYKIIKKNPFWVYDRIGIVVALGGAFVRIGNFFNSEIIGKAVDPNSFWAFLFPQQSVEYGPTIPRYPTQLFEAGGYFLLFLLLWYFYKYTKKKYQQGWLFGLFFIVLWMIRFVVEFFKEPQGDEYIHLGSLNTGQVLSIPFIIAGIFIMLYSSKNRISEE